MTFHIRALLASLGLLALLASFTAGRMSKPGRVVEVVRTVEVEKRVEVKVAVRDTASLATQAADVKWRTRTIYRPGGTVIVTRDVAQVATSSQATETKSQSSQMLAQEHAKATESTRIVEQARPSWSVGGSVGLGLDLRPRYGAEVGRRVWGGLWMTAGADISGRAAMVGARLEF